MWRAVLVLVVLLTACSEADKKRVLEALRHTDVVAGIARVATVSDTLIVSDVLSIEGTGEPSFTAYECTGNSCTRRSGQSLFSPIGTVAELTETVTDPTNERSDIRKHRGVDLAEYKVTKTRQEVDWTLSNYGAWLDYSAFETSIASGVRGSNVKLLTAYSLSFGKRTGTSPTGNAVWEGVMLGHTRHGAIHPLQGDAAMNFKLDVNTIDVSFTNIQNLETGDDVSSMQFSDIPVSGGTFMNRTDTAHIAGRFYGPAHEEVGGVFTYPTAMGAFGGRKQ